MKWLLWTGIGVICLALIDKWAGLGFIWPETSQKAPYRPPTGPMRHPSARKGADVVDFEAWHKQMWGGR